MVDKIQVSSFLKYLGEGISQPALVLSDKNERYILKTEDTIIEGKKVKLNCSFLNEIIAYQIADYLEAPVPLSAVAELDKTLLENGPSLRFVHRFTEGEFLPQRSSGKRREFIRKL